MKTCLILSLLIASGCALAQEPPSAGQKSLSVPGDLNRGASILSEQGKLVPYIEMAEVSGAIGRTVGSVFIGERLVQAADGSCQAVTTRLIGMKTVAVGALKVELPRVAGSSRTIACI